MRKATPLEALPRIRAPDLPPGRSNPQTDSGTIMGFGGAEFDGQLNKAFRNGGAPPVAPTSEP